MITKCSTVPFSVMPFSMGRLSKTWLGVGRWNDRGHGWLRNFGNRCACPFVRCCSCNFLTDPLRSRCAPFLWKTGWRRCDFTAISSLTVQAVQNESSGGPKLVTSGERHPNRSPSLSLLRTRLHCLGIVRALESLCCCFLDCVRALTVPSQYSSGQI